MSLPTPGFGARVAEVRQFRGWSQAELARRLGMDPNKGGKVWVSRLEGDKRQPELFPVGDLFRLAATLGVSPWALITGWQEDRPVDLGVDGVDKTTAGAVWDWTEWRERLDEDEEDVAAAEAWVRYSPAFRPKLDDEDLRVIHEMLSRRVEVDRDDTGGVFMSSRIDPALEVLIEEFRATAERIIEGKETR